MQKQQPAMVSGIPELVLDLNYSKGAKQFFTT
jgi:hypothetical protein